MCPLPTFAPAVHLVDDELRVEEHPDALDPEAAGELETFDEGPVFGDGVDGGSDPFGDLGDQVAVGVPENDPDGALGWIVDGPGAGTIRIQ
jgi:hypothetical protein